LDKSKESGKERAKILPLNSQWFENADSNENPYHYQHDEQHEQVSCQGHDFVRLTSLRCLYQGFSLRRTGGLLEESSNASPFILRISSADMSDRAICVERVGADLRFDS